MRADFETKDDVIIVRLKGESDFESVTSLNKVFEKYLTQKKVIFNLGSLHFVGSSGLADLMDTFKSLAQKSSIKFCHVGLEFRKIFAGTGFGHLKIYEDEKSAKNTFNS